MLLLFPQRRDHLFIGKFSFADFALFILSSLTSHQNNNNDNYNQTTTFSSYTPLKLQLSNEPKIIIIICIFFSQPLTELYRISQLVVLQITLSAPSLSLQIQLWFLFRAQKELERLVERIVQIDSSIVRSSKHGKRKSAKANKYGNNNFYNNYCCFQVIVSSLVPRSFLLDVKE